MSYSPTLSSGFSGTKNRVPNHISPLSGMCSACNGSCPGLCDIGRSVTRGSEAVYPVGGDKNQFGSEKNYPVDYSCFNINGRVFGAVGCRAEEETLSALDANLSCEIGALHPIKLKAPFVLPAMAKLDWEDYFAGAAMAGVLVVIGESAIGKDSQREMDGHKIKNSPMLRKMVESFRKYYHGYGDIILQANRDDDRNGVLEYAIRELGVTSVEIKFGQAAKGIQSMGYVKSLEKALKAHAEGHLIIPDPTDPKVQEDFKNGIGPYFMKAGRLPMWDEGSFTRRVAELRELGAKNIFVKMTGYDPEDIRRVLSICSIARVDMVTFDGAGGGSGNSPCKMMNEWGIPTVCLEGIVYDILREMEQKGMELPKVAITGGFAMEDQIFKALAFGEKYVSMVGIGRASMAAAMAGKKIGELVEKGEIPKDLQEFGTTVPEIFVDVRRLRAIYGKEADSFPTGAIGLYSYLERVSFGIQQFLALNRKFDVRYADRRDLVPLTREARELLDGSYGR